MKSNMKRKIKDKLKKGNKNIIRKENERKEKEI
jgi:hypothetical protein